MTVKVVFIWPVGILLRLINLRGDSALETSNLPRWPLYLKVFLNCSMGVLALGLTSFLLSMVISVFGIIEFPLIALGSLDLYAELPIL